MALSPVTTGTTSFASVGTTTSSTSATPSSAADATASSSSTAGSVSSTTGSSSDSLATTGSGTPSSFSLSAVGSSLSAFSSVGDPHETMGDGTKFNNENVGVYTALQSASGDFVVQHKLDHVAGFPDSVTLNTDAAIKMSGGPAGIDVVKLDAASGALTVNDSATTVAPGGSTALASGGKIALSADGKTYTVTSPQGDVVNLAVQSGGAGGTSHWIDMTGNIGPSRVDGEVTGELGTFHAAGGTDDMVKPDGSQATSTADLISAYAVPSGKSMFDLPASSFQTMSAADTEAKNLQAATTGLQGQVTSLDGQIVALKAKQASQQSAYNYLKGLPANEITPVDQQFMSTFEAGQTNLTNLQNQLTSVTNQINTNQQRLDALGQIDTLSSQNSALYSKEQSLGNDRLAALEKGQDVTAMTNEIGQIENQMAANTSQIAALDQGTGGTGSYATGTDPNLPSGSSSTSGGTTSSTSASTTGSTSASATDPSASTTASATTTASAASTPALSSSQASQVLAELPNLLSLAQNPGTSSEAAQALTALLDAIQALDATSTASTTASAA